MSSNLFIGQIPNTIGDLKALQSLDLSSNKLTGSIPENIEELHALQFLNLSFNDLEGTVPTDGVFRNHSAVYLEGNHNLCFSSCSTHHKKLRVSIVVVVVLASLVLCILAVSLLWVLYFKKKKVGVKDLDLIDVIKGKHRMISYDEIFHATNNFNPANLIGAGSFGSVYKGLLRDGMTTAIKVLNLAVRGASKSFITECEALRNVRHRNLVKLVTSCSSVDFANNDFQALVYEFMSNGSLDDWIKGRKRHETGEALSPLERLNIAIDVASAMDYLHNDCDGIVVHCDLKPSNVLLDDEMNAKVGDFGLAKLLVNKDGGLESFSTTNGLKGSIGYIPPEYGFGAKRSTRGDVYSYGVMLLELISGKSPTSFVGDLSLEKWARAAFPDRVAELIDTHLLGTKNALTCQENPIELEKQMECLVSMVRVGLSCAMESPDSRCSMRDALHELQIIKKTLNA
ncbi:hypothetical protein LUZ60_016371 [Juncus effusus]|nr:hypothetical protein LUZ60_016371 [Juncus effusus]